MATTDQSHQLMSWLLKPENLERLKNNKGVVRQLTKLKILPSSIRLYLRNLAGVTDKITEDFFSKSELKEIKKRVSQAKAHKSMGDKAISGLTTTGSGRDNIIGYQLEKGKLSLKKAFTDPATNIDMTLGQATFSTDEDGNITIKDKHDFSKSVGGGTLYENKEYFSPRKEFTSYVPHQDTYDELKEYMVDYSEAPDERQDDQWMQNLIKMSPNKAVSFTTPESDKQLFKRAKKAFEAGEIDASKYARIVAGVQQGDAIPVEIDIGKISHEDKLKASPDFAEYIASDTRFFDDYARIGERYEDVGIPSQIREEARKYYAHKKGGRIGFDDGGPSQKDIDKGIAAIEKLKSSLMPESYEELIEIYKDKQKDLNIDIMESAGGLGEMLGEGGRVGMQGGGWPFWLLKMLGKAKDSPWTKKKAIPYMKDKLNKNKIKEFFNKDIVEELDKAGRKLRVDASLGNPMPNWPLNLGIGSVGLATLAHFLLKKANQEGEYPEYRLDRDSTKYWDFQDLLKEEGLKMGEMDKIKLREEKGRNLFEGLDYEDRAQGGRVGMMYGGDPGFAFSYGGSWADWKDNHASEMPLMDYINQKLPKARNPFSNGGEVEISWEEVFAKHMQGQPLTEEERKILGNVPADKAEGGRIGLANGTTMDAFDSMTPNRQYMMTGESDVHRIQPPMGGILPLAGRRYFCAKSKRQR